MNLIKNFLDTNSKEFIISQAESLIFNALKERFLIIGRTAPDFFIVKNGNKFDTGEEKNILSDILNKVPAFLLSQITPNCENLNKDEIVSTIRNQLYKDLKDNEFILFWGVEVKNKIKKSILVCSGTYNNPVKLREIKLSDILN